MIDTFDTVRNITDSYAEKFSRRVKQLTYNLTPAITITETRACRALATTENMCAALSTGRSVMKSFITLILAVAVVSTAALTFTIAGDDTSTDDSIVLAQRFCPRGRC